jgi:hypothetical protein
MKKVLTKTLFTGLACLTISGYSLDSHQEDTSSNSQENVNVNSRPLSQEKQQQMQSSRMSESEEASDEAYEYRVELSTLIIPIKDKDFVTLASSQPNQMGSVVNLSLYHWIESFPQDNIIKTEDGAEWIFDKNDNYILRTWRPSDTIVVSPKGRWLWGSNYSYVMVNKDLGSSIDVNLFLGPVAFGNFSTWIVGIDQNNGHIYLLNGMGERTVWEISNVDLYLFKDWEVNDTLIVGQNDSWFWWFSSYNHILINVNMNHFVRARQISGSSVYRNAIGMRG